MKTKYLNLVGSYIRRERYKRGWSQEIFTAKLQIAGANLSRSAVSKIEARIRQVNDGELIIILYVLNVTFEDILPNRQSKISFRDYINQTLEIAS